MLKPSTIEAVRTRVAELRASHASHYAAAKTALAEAHALAEYLRVAGSQGDALATLAANECAVPANAMLHELSAPERADAKRTADTFVNDTNA